jgi:hypothetical protein
MDPVSLKSDPESAGKHLGVACETCHGPARDHVAFNKRLINVTIGRDLELAARETIRKSKPTAACIQCHLREAHKKHPEFERAAVERIKGNESKGSGLIDLNSGGAYAP